MIVFKRIWRLISILLIIFPSSLLACADVTTTTTTTTTVIVAEVECQCLDACAAYVGERYDDCVDFCSYNEEPIPLCMCDAKYIRARGRLVHAFAVDSTPGKTNVADCANACENTRSDAGPSIGWTKLDCFCICPNFEDLIGYGM